MANKGPITKPTQGQLNTMEARFARLEALVINMVAHVKSNTSGSRKVKDWKHGQSYGLDVDP